ncbi:Septin-domain-containing protein [Schizophyllum fasciatum]
MFTFRRKPSRKDDAPPPRIRATPSLPELASQRIPWPEDLVDARALHREHPPVSFHRPFRASSQTESEPSARHTPSHRYTHRRARLPPTFNIMVAGGRGTGKTSLLRLLLETADVSPAATADQRAALARFLRGPPRPTPAIATACVEIRESPAHRLLLSAVDTPGLDFAPGRELALERQVAALVKYLEAQYADTMSEESKVVRQNKGDQHIHLCIYLIDPASVKPAERTQPRPSSADADAAAPALALAPADLRVLRRLAARCNVLPVVARSDALTDGALAAVKRAVRRDLRAAGIDFGVFAPQGEGAGGGMADGGHSPPSTPSQDAPSPPAPSTTSSSPTSPTPSERAPRGVIKLRPSRHRSRSRRARSVAPAAGEGNSALLAAEGGDPARLAADDSGGGPEGDNSAPPSLADAESVANVRFAARALARADLGAALPFALIAPEAGARPHGVGRAEGEEEEGGGASDQGTGEGGQEGAGVGAGTEEGQEGAGATRLGRQQGAGAPPADLKGVFVRRYRWGVVDVLDPRHCDFALMRTAVLGTHLQPLKTRTKEVLYEKYRTEKLLARRATANISEDERARLLEELGL